MCVCACWDLCAPGPAPQVSLAVLLVLVGLTTYYLVPLAFISQNYGMFLGILTAVLLGMLLGLSMVATSLQNVAERVMVWLLIWGRDRNLVTIVVKHLNGHRNRNRKTAYMVSIAVAFLIFAGAMFALQSRSIQDTVRLLLGCDINVLSLSGFGHALPQVCARLALRPQAPSRPLCTCEGACACRAVWWVQAGLLRYLSTVTVGSPGLPPGDTPIVAAYTFLTFPLSYVRPPPLPPPHASSLSALTASPVFAAGRRAAYPPYQPGQHHAAQHAAVRHSGQLPLRHVRRLHDGGEYASAG